MTRLDYVYKISLYTNTTGVLSNVLADRYVINVTITQKKLEIMKNGWTKMEILVILLKPL